MINPPEKILEILKPAIEAQKMVEEHPVSGSCYADWKVKAWEAIRAVRDFIGDDNG